MGLLALNWFMSMQRGQKRNRRGHSQPNQSIGSLAKRDGLPRQQDDNSYGCKRIRYSSDLPEDIWHHILSIVPMKDAAHAACVCHAFLRSWRCHPNLTFTKKTMCLKELRKGTAGLNDIKEYAANIDHVLTKHSGVGVKIFKIDYRGPYDDKTYNRLNNWLQIAVTPWIEELDLNIQRPRKTVNFNFPCALLSERCRDSIQRLHLANCNLHSAFEPGLTSLTVLRLYNVHITGDELGCLLSDSLALEALMLIYCNDIRRLEIPCVLQRPRNLLVVECLSLRVIENKAPKYVLIWRIVASEDAELGP